MASPLSESLARDITLGNRGFFPRAWCKIVISNGPNCRAILMKTGFDYTCARKASGTQDIAKYIMKGKRPLAV